MSTLGKYRELKKQDVKYSTNLEINKFWLIIFSILTFSAFLFSLILIAKIIFGVVLIILVIYRYYTWKRLGANDLKLLKTVSKIDKEITADSKKEQKDRAYIHDIINSEIN